MSTDLTVALTEALAGRPECPHEQAGFRSHGVAFTCLECDAAAVLPVVAAERARLLERLADPAVRETAARSVHNSGACGSGCDPFPSDRRKADAVLSVVTAVLAAGEALA